MRKDTNSGERTKIWRDRKIKYYRRCSFFLIRPVESTPSSQNARKLSVSFNKLILLFHGATKDQEKLPQW